MFIETKEPFANGQNIALTFSIPNSEIPFRISGEIVRTADNGIAVQFKPITEYQKEIIQSLIDKADIPT